LSHRQTLQQSAVVGLAVPSGPESVTAALKNVICLAQCPSDTTAQTDYVVVMTRQAMRRKMPAAASLAVSSMMNGRVMTLRKGND
jgi:hypothetical protein